MATVHAAMKKHPDYKLAFYCAAISGIQNRTHREMFDVYSSVLTNRVLDAFGVGLGTVAVGSSPFRHGKRGVARLKWPTR